MKTGLENYFIPTINQFFKRSLNDSVDQEMTTLQLKS